MKISSAMRATGLAACLLAAASASQATASNCDATAGNLVTNCGFETGDLTGWTATGNDVPLALGNGYGGELGVDPFDGIAPNSGEGQAFFADLVANATTLSQLIATTAGATYTVSFYAAQDTAPPSAPDYNSNLLSASFAGITGVNLSKVPMEGYTLYSFAAVATGATSALSITLGNDSGQFLLDDVTVTSPTSAVAEPNLPLLLSAGLCVISLLRLRRH